MKMLKKANNYRITIENMDAEESLVFEVQDKENMLDIVNALQEKSGLEKDDATRLGVAIRLLGPLMMMNRKDPLFVDFFPSFKNFMTNLKSTLKNR